MGSDARLNDLICLCFSTLLRPTSFPPLASRMNPLKLKRLSLALRCACCKIHTKYTFICKDTSKDKQMERKKDLEISNDV